MGHEKFEFDGTIYTTIFENRTTIIGYDTNNKKRLVRKDDCRVKLIKQSTGVNK